MESILVSQSASKDVSKNAEPPPMLIFCYSRNLRYSTVFTTFFIEPKTIDCGGNFLDSARMINIAHLGMFSWAET